MLDREKIFKHACPLTNNPIVHCEQHTCVHTTVFSTTEKTQALNIDLFNQEENEIRMGDSFWQIKFDNNSLGFQYRRFTRLNCATP